MKVSNHRIEATEGFFNRIVSEDAELSVGLTIAPGSPSQGGSVRYFRGGSLAAANWVDPDSGDYSVSVFGNNVTLWLYTLHSGSRVRLQSPRIDLAAQDIRMLGLPSSDPVQSTRLYRVTDFQGSGHDVIAISSGTVTPPSEPGSPGICRQSNALVISWSAVSGASYYDVQRQVAGSGSWEVIASSVSGTSTGDTWPQNEPDTSYQYRVRACNDGGCSSYGSASTGTTFNAASPC